jgi:hypothetical protein
MADMIDEANEHRDKEEAAGVQAARDKAAQIPAGEPGDCDFCGEWSGRLVGGACAPCRDGRGLP